MYQYSNFWIWIWLNLTFVQPGIKGFLKIQVCIPPLLHQETPHAFTHISKKLNGLGPPIILTSTLIKLGEWSNAQGRRKCAFEKG